MAMSPAIHKRRVRRLYRGRGSSVQRGYDRRWTKLRKIVFERDLGLCQCCDRQGRTRSGREVDHIKPFHGLDDPKRLDPANCELLCVPCHAEKTNDDYGGNVR